MCYYTRHVTELRILKSDYTGELNIITKVLLKEVDRRVQVKEGTVMTEAERKKDM